MRYIVSLILGALIGAGIALLFAPSSGEELRSNIKTQADIQAARAREEWEKGVKGVQELANQVNTGSKQPVTPRQETEAVASN